MNHTAPGLWAPSMGRGAATVGPRAIFLVLLAAVGGSGFFFRAAGETRNGSPVAASEVPGLLPESCLALLTVHGGPCIEFGKDLALRRILAEAEIQKFLEPFSAWLRGRAGPLEQKVKEVTGLTLEECAGLLRNRISIALVGIQETTERHGAESVVRWLPDLVLVLEIGQEMEPVRRFLRALETTVQIWGEGNFSDATVSGHAVRKYEPPPGAGMHAWYLVHESLLILATRLPTLEGILMRLKSGNREGSLAVHPGFQGVQNQVARAGSLLTAYIALEQCVKAATPHLPEDASMLLDASGAAALKAVGYGLDIDGPGLHDRIYVHAPEGGPLVKAFKVEGAGVCAPDVVPAETGFLLAGVIGPEQIFDWVKNLAGDLGLGSFVEEAVEDVREGFGVELREELLSVVGPEIVLYASWPGRSLVPDVGLFLELRDQAKAETAIDRFVERLPSRVRIGSITAFDHEIHHLTLPGGAGGAGVRVPLSIKPSWTYFKNRLLVTLWPQAAKNMLAGWKTQSPRLATRDDFSRGFQRVRGAGVARGSAAVCWLDLAALAGFVCDNGIPLCQSLLGAEIPADFASFPVTETVKQHLFGLVGSAHWTKDGLAFDVFSPAGVVPSLLAAGSVAWFGVRVGEMPPVSGEVPAAQEITPPPAGEGRSGENQPARERK